MPSTITDRLDGLTTSVAVKAPCRVATTANITLSGTQTIDGVAVVAGDRVLAKNQTSAVDNGIWVCGAGTWARATDFDGTFDGVGGTRVSVTSGTVNENSEWRTDGDGAIVIGTDSITWERATVSDAGYIAFSHSASYAAGTIGGKLSDTISVKDAPYNAVGDGTTDDSTALLDAMTDAVDNDTVLYFPKGRYYCPNSGGSQLRVGTGSLRMRGEGMTESVLLFDDDVSASRRDFLSTDPAAPLVDFEMYDMGIEGSWGDDATYTQRSQLTNIDFTGRAIVQRCRFSKSRLMSLILIGGDTAHVSDCEFYRGPADGCRLIDVKHTVVVNNRFEDINDDSIGIHSLDATAAPIDISVVVEGNTITNGQGIAVLGAKMASICNNVISRVQTRAILVGCIDASTSTEGNTAPININIQGNIINDVFSGAVFSGLSSAGLGWIVVRNLPLSQGGAAGFVGYIDGSGGIVEPYDYIYTNDVDEAASTNPGNWWVKVTGNICTRTLPAATNYSDYGFGTRYGRSGPVDPAITLANFSQYPIRFMEHGQGCLISENIVEGGTTGIWLDGTTGKAYTSWNDVAIRGNIVRNVSSEGIYTVGLGAPEISDNTLDGDPYHAHAERLANGKWDTGYANFAALRFSEAYGIVRDNTIRNWGVVYRGATINNGYWEGNILACNPVATGYNADNIGIGDLSLPARLGAVLFVEDGDPANATYGRPLNACLKASATLPTAGTYLRGHITMKADPVVAGGGGSQYVIIGWVRITTGAGHVLNTDWAEMRTLTGT